MNCNYFQQNHLIKLLEGFNLESIPLDLFVHRYFKSNRALGANDRRVIQKASYEIIKNLCFIGQKADKPLSWQTRVKAYLSLELENEILKNTEMPEYTRFSMPKWLYEKMHAQYGPKKSQEICDIMRKKAPIYIRTNTLKTNRDKLYETLKKDLDLELVPESKNAIKVLKPTQFKSFNEYLEGHFTIQDLSSQLVIESLELDSAIRALDYCAGSGGKSLHLAARLENKGQVNLFDIRKNILLNAKSRLKNAGAFNAKIYFEKTKLGPLKHKMDLVLVDVPCSGSGTFRRNPEQKYKLTPERFKELLQMQKEIVQDSICYLKPGATLLYSTCSIFEEENQLQIEYFEKNFNLQLKKPSVQILPKESSGDGFFFAEMKLKA